MVQSITEYVSYFEAGEDMTDEEYGIYMRAIHKFAYLDIEPDYPSLPPLVKAALRTVIFSIKNPQILLGLTNTEIRNSAEYKQWRKQVLKRDSFICQKCGATNKKLNVHHIKRFAKDIANRFNVANGITLCVDCHRELHKREGR